MISYGHGVDCECDYIIYHSYDDIIDDDDEHDDILRSEKESKAS